MRESISKVSLVVYAFLLFFSALLLSAPGGRVEWFCVMGVFAVPAIVAGPKRYRVLGVIALLVAVVLAVSDYQAGRRWQKMRDEREKQYRKDPNVLSAVGVEGGKVTDQ